MTGRTETKPPTKPPSKPPRRIPCSLCGKETTWENNPWRPFCSERCKLTDLGAWADEKYRMPSEDAPGTDETED